MYGLDELEAAVVAAAAQRQWPAVNDALAPLVEAAGAGDSAAVATLVGVVHRTHLARGVVAGLLSSEVDIDDAEQVTLVQLARSVDAFRGDAQFTTWLFSIARNAARMQLRTRSRHAQPAPAGAVLDPAVPVDGRISSMVADKVGLGELVARLTPEHAEVVCLRELEGRSYEEIAGLLEVPVGTVRSRLSRAREALAVLAAQWEH